MILLFFSHPNSKKILLLLLLQRALKVWSADFPPPLQEKEAHRHGGSIGFNQNRANPPRVARIRLPVSVSACGRQVRGRWVIKLTHSWCWHDRLSLARRSLMQGWMQWSNLREASPSWLHYSQFNPTSRKVNQSPRVFFFFVWRFHGLMTSRGSGSGSGSLFRAPESQQQLFTFNFTLLP